MNNLGKFDSFIGIFLPTAPDYVCQALREHELLILTHGLAHTGVLRCHIHSQNTWPRILLNHILNGYLNIPIERLFLMKYLPHDHPKRICIHLPSRVVVLLRRLETLGGGTDGDGFVAVKHIRVSLEIIHFKLANAHSRIMQIKENVVSIDVPMGDRRGQFVQLAENFGKFYQDVHFLVERKALLTHARAPERLTVQVIVQGVKLWHDNIDDHMGADVHTQRHYDIRFELV